MKSPYYEPVIILMIPKAMLVGIYVGLGIVKLLGYY